MKLPPMNSLRAFEAVSRLGSVSSAADELCVSQGAVSQQLRNLETHLDRELFIRTPNSFVLSEKGETFATVVQRSLGEIALAAREVARTNSRQGLTVSASPIFAHKWLIPNLNEFYESFPDIPVVFDIDLAMVTFKNDGIDAAIRFVDGKDRLHGLNSVLLFHVQQFAVASPTYIAEHGKLKSLAEPRTHRLIDGTYNVKTGGVFTKWQDLVSGNQADATVYTETFPDNDQILSAALSGRGIAILPLHDIVDGVASGNLVYASPEPISSPMKCYFVSPADARPNGDLIAFRDWLVDSLKKFRVEENM